MQRRAVIASLALFFVSLREGIRFSQKETSSFEPTTPLVQSDGLIKLNQDFKFYLPENPQNGQIIYFRPVEGVKQNPSLIVAVASHNIMGQSEPMEVDESIPFALIFNAEYKSWILSTQTFEANSLA